MSKFDGTAFPLSYADALVEIAMRVSPWPSEGHRDEVIKALQTEHGTYIVPEAETKALELERLRALAAEADLKAANEAQDAELALLRAKLGLPDPTATATDPVPTA